MIMEISRPQDADRASKHTIGEIARMYNVSPRTLRFYEERELLRPERIGSVRYYSGNDRTRLELVLTGKRLGFSLAAIEELIRCRLHETAGRGRLAESLSKQEIASQIGRLEAQRRSLDEAIAELHDAFER